MESPVMEDGMAVWMDVRDLRSSAHRASSRFCLAKRLSPRGSSRRDGQGEAGPHGSAVTSKGIRFSRPTLVAKMVKAVVILSPISLQACSMLFFTLSSMRKFTMTCAMNVTPFRTNPL